jgi:hypothetical protein
MAQRIAWLLCGCLALAAGEPGVSSRIAGGTVPGLAVKTEGRVDISGDEALLFRCREASLRIRYDRIHTLEYGQHVSRRYAEGILISPVLLLSKSRKHFVTVGFTDDEGHRQALVFQVGKGDVRAVLAGLEAKTGRRVEYQDEEARHGGKG